MGGAAILATFVGGTILDEIVESGQYLRAGIRTFRNQREFRVSGKLLDWLTGNKGAGNKGTHWTSTKLLKWIKELLR